MKSQELIHCLEKEEIKLFRLRLKAKGSSSSLVVLDVLKKNNPENKLEKDYLFTLIFKKEYSRKLDFRLRHVLRVFNEEIEHFIAMISFSEKAENNFTENYNPSILLLRFLLERKSYSLFEKEWNKYYKKAKEKKYFNLELKLIDLYYNYVTCNQEEKIKYYDKITNLLKIAVQSVQSEYLEQIRGLEQKIGFIYYTAMFTGNDIPEKKYKDLTTIPDEILEDEFFKYHQLLAQSFYEKNHEERIVIFNQLLKSHNHASAIRPDLAINERDYNNWLGHCFYFLNNYEAAARCFERCIELMTANPKWLRLEIIFNYISILTKLERFSEPIPIYEKYKSKIVKNERVKYRFGYMIAICLIFEGSASKAWDLLPKDIQNRPQNDFYYSRFIMAMIYFEEKEYDFFEREVTNIYQTAHYKAPNEILWLDVSKVFKKMSRIFLLPKPERKKESEKLIAEIDELDEKYPMFKDVLPVKWLVAKIS